MKNSVKAHLAVLTANMVFSVNFSVVKYVTPGLIRPFGLNVLRVVVSTSLFWLLVLFEKNNKPVSKKHHSLLLLCGITGVSINQLLFIKGLSLTYPIHAALLMLCTPILITIIAFFLLNESATLPRIAGLALGIAGAVVLIRSREQGSASASDIFRGDVMILLNAISYAFYFVLVKPLILTYKPMQVIRWVFLYGTLFILPFGWKEFTEISWQSFTWLNLAGILFVVLGATFLAYLLNLYGLQHLDAGATGAYIYLQPVLATLVAVLFFGENITTTKILSAILIFAGVYLVNRRSI